MQFFYEKTLLWIFLNLFNPTSILCCCFFIILCTFDEGHMERWRTWKDINCMSKWQSKSYPGTREESLYREKLGCVQQRDCSRTLTRICVAGIGDFGERLRKRLVKRSDAKRKWMSWKQQEQIAQDVEWDIVGLWSRRRNSYKHM